MTSQQSLAYGITVEQGDELGLFVVGNSASTTTVRVTVNLLDSNGNRASTSIDSISSTDRSYTEVFKQLSGPSIIVSAVAAILSGTLPTLPGNVWIYCEVRRGGSPIALLLSGYVYRG